MRYLFLIGAVALAGCATMERSPSQNYRFSGQEGTTAITGHIERGLTSQVLHVYFDGKEVVTGELDYRMTGDIVGKEWAGKAVSASCSSKSNQYSLDVRCMVFHGNERTVTLTF